VDAGNTTTSAVLPARSLSRGMLLFYRPLEKKNGTLEAVAHTIRTVLGIILLILAVIGSLLPLVQGWIFFLAAVGVLGTDHVIIKWCYRQMDRGKQWLRQLHARWRR